MEKVTGVMGITPMEGDDRTIRNLTDIMIYSRHSCRHWITLFTLLLSATLVEAGDWDITPRISVSETYSDNVNLDDNDKEWGMVTEVTPGIGIHGEGARVRADLDYQMQNTFFLRDSDGNGTFHQLKANGIAEVTKNFFFVDGASTMGQAVVDANDTASTGNLNNAGNRTDFYTYSLSPYILPHFGNVANGSLRYTYSSVNFDDGASDSEQHRFDAGLTSGRFWGPLSWSGEYHHDEMLRDSTSDTKFEGASGNARYLINNKFSLVAQGGYEHNDFQSSQDNENGTYWALGVFWQPSRFYSLEALTGNNLTTVTVSLYPTQRTALVVNYSDMEVGRNPGEVWTGSFQHRTRRTNWNASYSEETTTTQELFLEEGGVAILGIDPVTGLVNDDPQPGDLIVSVPFGPVTSITDEVIERKRASGSVGLRTGKTGLRFTVFNEKRSFLSSQTEEETKGFSGSWDRRLAPRTNSIVTGSWQRITNEDNSERDFWFVETKLNRQIRPRLNGNIFYRFSREESDGNRDGYEENRIGARITAHF